MKMRAIILSVILVIGVNYLYGQASNYRKIDEKGVGNLVFANQAITKGKESSFNLKKSFGVDEKIYARAYFPKALSNYGLVAGDKIVLVVYVDNQQVDRAYIKPKYEWDQIQVYVMNTGSDDFIRLNAELSSLPSGKHRVTVSVGLQKYSHMETVVKDDGTIKKERVDKVVVISQSDIEVNVK